MKPGDRVWVSGEKNKLIMDVKGRILRPSRTLKYGYVSVFIDDPWATAVTVLLETLELLCRVCDDRRSYHVNDKCLFDPGVWKP